MVVLSIRRKGKRHANTAIPETKKDCTPFYTKFGQKQGFFTENDRFATKPKSPKNAVNKGKTAL